MIYLSSTTNLPEAYQQYFGVMFSANKTIAGLNQALQAGWPWMMDNNAFTGAFRAETWIKALIKNLPYRKTCIGIPIPDQRLDALQTLRNFSQYWRVVHDLGYPVAFVTQDGITPELAPWDYFEVLFVGGTDDHQLGGEAGAMIAEAKARGKWVHVGRVNSAGRIKRFWMADSTDGTHLTREYNHAAAQLFADAVLYCQNKKAGHITASGQYAIGAI